MSTLSVDDGYVPIKELALALNLDRSVVLKYVKRKGYTLHQRRSREAKGQFVSAVSESDAEQIISERRVEGDSLRSVDGQPIASAGVFYLIQLVPELSPHRIKMGFAASMEERLRQHRTAAPTAVVVKTWPCRRVWEIAALDSISRTGCTPYSAEVFDCDDMESLVRRADEFFSLMPSS